MSDRRSSFDVTDPAVFFRLMLGALYLPHIAFKLMDLNGAQAFFGKAGFHPALFFVVLALVMESVSAIGLIFNLYLKYTGLISAGVIAVATYAVIATKGPGWLWNLGGVEYLVLWCSGSFVLALNAWRKEVAQYGRVFLLQPA
ncbi:DoxX family protein [Bradyrhizobium sp. STM 3843]|uniref:DoxX family protein n=1 Tax=Bradyrhizobium sp. STM 3843 TaxID=551947 RepID=UPI000240A9F4|nr:DoxX family protein [Bradyrhizobium sp. STM 3843]CCE05137.1 DoxX family protein [Bradyrhizobium sp. STM 3843]